MESLCRVCHVLRDGLLGDVADTFHRRLQGEKVVATPRTQVRSNALRDPAVVRGNDLTRVLPVDLVTVVCSRVVGSCNHDSCAAVVGGNAEGLRETERNDPTTRGVKAN